MSVIEAHDERSKSELRKLQAFLGVSNVPHEYHERLEGSCEWLNEREDFIEWSQTQDANDVDPTTTNNTYKPSVYWVNANPGAGKTILASHVISQLEKSRLQCAFYYFKTGTKASKLPYFLRSIAYQMAASNSIICGELMKLYDEGTTFDIDDARAIWSKIFRASILKVCSLYIYPKPSYIHRQPF